MVGFPGLRRFHYTDVLDADRRTAFDRAVVHILPAMVRFGYDVVVQSEPQILVFEIRERPMWVPLVCILGFPIGLIALAYKDTQRIVVTFEELERDRTRLTSSGLARRSVRRAFAELGE